MTCLLLIALQTADTADSPLIRELQNQARLGFPREQVEVFFSEQKYPRPWVFATGAQNTRDPASVRLGSVLAIYSPTGKAWTRAEGLCEPSRYSARSVSPDALTQIFNDERIKKLTRQSFLVGIDRIGEELFLDIGPLPLVVDGELIVIADATTGRVKRVVVH